MSDSTDPLNKASAFSASRFVQDAVHAPDTQVVIFALTWCSYCKAAKRLFTQLDVPFTAIDLDTPEYERSGRFRPIRQALQELTGSGTLPQVFIAGQALGGYTETRAAQESGKLQKLLAAAPKPGSTHPD